MARHEADREDLFREATALVRRVEVVTNGITVVAGFRRPAGCQTSGCLSVYLGPDFVLNFNESGEIRRAFHRGLLYRADTGRMLTRLRRERDVSTSTLFASEMSDQELKEFVALALSSLNEIVQSTRSGAAIVLRSEPPDDATAIIGAINATIEGIIAAGLPIADGM